MGISRGVHEDWLSTKDPLSICIQCLEFSVSQKPYIDKWILLAHWAPSLQDVYKQIVRAVGCLSSIGNQNGHEYTVSISPASRHANWGAKL